VGLTIESSDDSQFEGIAFDQDNDVLYLLAETYMSKSEGLVSRIYEAVHEPHADTYEIVAICEIFQNFYIYVHFNAENKGFEGIEWLGTFNGKPYVLAICEGNYCVGGKKSKEAGNGRAVMLSLHRDTDKCEWKTERVFPIPSEAFFTDYSGIDVLATSMETYKVVISSQEASAIWISEFNIHSGFKSGGRILNFAPDDACQTV